MTPTQEANQLYISILQNRANAYGFAIAMREPPQTTEEIRKVSSALDEIIGLTGSDQR